MASYAGLIAEKLYTGKRNVVGAAYDRKQIGDFAIRACGSAKDVPRYTQSLRRKTAEWIKYPIHWHAVCAVAEQLAQRITLSHKQVKQIINDIK
jgi:hypothetical protein